MVLRTFTGFLTFFNMFLVWLSVKNKETIKTSPIEPLKEMNIRISSAFEDNSVSSQKWLIFFYKSIEKISSVWQSLS